ncbi:ABC transporter permease [Pleurocapsa sp. PCC 7319]|uniref:ABC transporter permease n=1 Tax=Pleurocapsa sp. PCC 7319 TaxID=118161 RepID=UPI00034C2673|nr:ABC transporter permease [Pleurocapsa sp. PCC 7319]
MIFSNIIAIAQKELQNYFASPLAYIVAAVFWLISGLFFVEILIGEQGIIQQVALSEQMGADIGSIDVASELLNSYLAILGTLSLFIIPMLSMGLYAEERKQRTLELLATSPITNWVVALGKLLAVIILFIFMILPSLVYEAIAFSAAAPPLPPAVPLLAHLGLVLFAASLLSLGMFISSLTNSTILAAILTFTAILLLWMIDLIANNLGGWLSENLEHISLLKSYNNLVQGVSSTSDFVLFFSYIFLGLFLTAQSINLFRFNRQ